jgi:hypothetical protein
MNLRALLAPFSAQAGLCEVQLCWASRQGRRFVSPRRWSVEVLSVGFAASPGALGQQFGDDHEIVGEHRGGDK